MERWSNRKSDKWVVIMLVVGMPVVLTAGSAALLGYGFGEAVFRFSVIFAVCGLAALLLLWEKRSLGRAGEDAWRTVCHVLESAHSHDGVLLKGTWKGRPFHAFVTPYRFGVSVGLYQLAMPAEHLGPAWKAERADWTGGSKDASQWTIRAEVGNAEERLVEAGLLVAIDEAEQRAVHLRPGIRVSFHPGSRQITYEDRSGEPPCEHDLVVHLDLVRRAVDVHVAAMATTRDPY